ncbi:SPOR domain-containing protein [Prevotella sp. AGR2160]|uniref:HU domain-containing protein n=1 Tax=Prevotella sp. AGR2160 TaxID=1280674 RepID=UPI00048EA482|nr:SPOR domain-containing protein [Prevotella sp. AGR2160]
MIHIDRHIEILLLNNDCVIVPDFGGFMAHHVDARYDESDGSFIPPLRTIGFNPQLTMNDSLLAQSYVEAYDISYPEAVARIDEEVRELRQHLDNEGRYELNDIGVLSRDEEGHIVFEPCEAGLLTPSLYGLGNFEMKPLAALRAEQETESAPVISMNATVTTNSRQQTEDDATVTAECRSAVAAENEEPKTISIRVSLLRNIAAAAIAIIAFLFLSMPLGPQQGQQALRSKIDTGYLTRLFPAETTQPAYHVAVANGQSATQPSTSTAAKSAVKTVTKSAVTPGTPSGACALQAQGSDTARPFAIVLASHVTKANAAAYVAKLNRKGYVHARVLSVPGEHTKVVYGHYISKEAAGKALSKLSDDCSDFRNGCWIMKTKE